MALRITLDYRFRPVPRYGYGRAPHALLYARINERRQLFARYLTEFASFQSDILEIPLDEAADAPGAPYWNNGYFPELDAISLHCLLCLRRPRLFMEVGSGHSTRFARNAIGRRSLATQIVSIDPLPRCEIDPLCDEVIRQPLEDVSPDYFDRLGTGDMLFIDSSHRAFTNSDVTVFFLDILPRLKSGVIIHFHDIMLPYDYPAEWSDRFYNEQYLLACALLAPGAAFAIELANTFITQDPELNELVTQLFSHPDRPDVSQHPWLTRSGWSFWLVTH
jgi:hypothetical protein